MRTAMRRIEQVLTEHGPLATAEPGVQWREGQLVDALEDGSYRLSDGGYVRPATSCVLRPQTGDRVLLVQVGGEAFILAILSRRETTARLNVPGAERVELSAPQLALTATESIAVQSLRDIDVTAATGRLSFNARHLLTTVTEALIENAGRYIAHMGDYMLRVQALFHRHSREAIVTAEQDMKVDAERISLG